MTMSLCFAEQIAMKPSPLIPRDPPRGRVNSMFLICVHGVKKDEARSSCEDRASVRCQDQ